jgi:hypothetical protein
MYGRKQLPVAAQALKIPGPFILGCLDELSSGLKAELGHLEASHAKTLLETQSSIQSHYSHDEISSSDQQRHGQEHRLRTGKSKTIDAPRWISQPACLLPWLTSELMFGLPLGHSSLLHLQRG